MTNDVYIQQSQLVNDWAEWLYNDEKDIWYAPRTIQV